MSPPLDELRAEQLRLDRLYARLDQLRIEAAENLAGLRRSSTAGTPAGRVERDAMIAQARATVDRLAAVEERLCIGRLDLTDGSQRYIGRIGLTDPAGNRLLVDWRAPAATPFYRATRAEPDGVLSRRHLITRGRTVTGIQDEVLDLAGFEASGRPVDTVSADDALMLALNARRTGRMRDIVATIQAEQDRIIRAPAAGALVVQGGPGTGKTVVALHRAAYLLYAHRDRLSRTGVLVVGPNHRFLDYISQVLPSLGETGVLLATAGQLYPGVDAQAEESEAAVAIKGDLRMAAVLAAAVKDRQRVPRRPVELAVEGTRILLMPAEVAAARHRAQLSRKPHNVARLRFVNDLLGKLAARLATALNLDLDDDTRSELLNALRDSPDVRREVNLCWMPVSPEKLLRDLYADPARLPAAAPRLTEAERQALYRKRTAPWTPADVALLDEAAELLGTEPEPVDQRAAADRAAELEYAGRVLDLVAELSPEAARMTTAESLADRYGGQPLRRSLLAEAATDRGWAFGHLVVDEAQELSAMQWRLLMRRCPSRSMTVVGDIAQTGSPAGARSWAEMLQPYLADRWRLAELTVNYRTPAEIMRVATGMLAAAGAGSSPVTSARSVDSALTVQRLAGSPADRVAELAHRQLAEGGQLAVITAAVGSLRDAVESLCDAGESLRYAGESLREAGELLRNAVESVRDAGKSPGDALADRLVLLSPAQAKGLEFDQVLLVEPAQIVAASGRGLSDLYVAMTRATQRLHIVHAEPLPAVLETALRAGDSEAASQAR